MFYMRFNFFFSLIQVIKNFSQQLDEWLKVALDSLPSGIREIKFDRKWYVMFNITFVDM